MYTFRLKNGQEIVGDVAEISKKGKICLFNSFDGEVQKLKLNQFENWLGVLHDFAENVMCFDGVTSFGNILTVSENLYISPENPTGEFRGVIKAILHFVAAIRLAGVFVNEIIYRVSENEYLLCELHLELG